ncbi:hypothetical protein DFH27DRAFT_522875 [Peziza echinospora]|nr:hypothetical protein DFH27DRAFT_522875 [Peziza echinospora]
MSTTKALIMLLAAFTPSVMGHMAMMHPAVYGWNGAPQKLIEPLHSMPFGRWWFHGELNNGPKNGEKVQLVAGGITRIELACGKQHTSFGGAPPSMNNPCPTDTPAAHSGPGIPEDKLRGCGLAIAYNNNVHAVKKEDFVIFSVKHRCVKDRMNDFAVPKLPKCDGKCICAWFWQGQVSNDEMYMNGFDCEVLNPGTQKLKKPQPPRECRDNQAQCVQGAKNPMYWANEGTNIQFMGRDRLPAYQKSWGFNDGAQHDILQ